MEKFKLNRRRFIALSSAAFLAWKLPSSRRLWAAPNGTDPGPVVWETTGIQYEQVSALFQALGGIARLLPCDPQKATVVIKPNICLPDPGARGTTTSVEVVSSMCRWLVSQGVRRIIVVDHTLRKTADFAAIEFMQLPVTYPEVKLLLANEERMYEPVEVPGKVLHSVARLKLLAKADLFINVATAKHHAATHVSLGVKNLMGTIWNRSDFHTKLDLAQAVGDLPLAMHPAVTVIDATRVLLNGGPTGPGTILTENRLFASRDIVAVDAVVASRYNFDGKSLPPADIPHLRAAAENGAGEINLGKISVKKV